MYIEKVTIENKAGLHSRPAVMFVQTAGKFKSDVTITKGDKVAVAKSIINILSLAITYGTEIEISAEGPDEELAVKELVKLIKSKFGEE